MVFSIDTVKDFFRGTCVIEAAGASVSALTPVSTQKPNKTNLVKVKIEDLILPTEAAAKNRATELLHTQSVPLLGGDQTRFPCPCDRSTGIIPSAVNSGFDEWSPAFLCSRKGK